MNLFIISNQITLVELPGSQIYGLLSLEENHFHFQLVSHAKDETTSCFYGIKFSSLNLYHKFIFSFKIGAFHQ